MKILVVTRHFGCLRNYEQALVELANRGHSLHLAAVHDDEVGGEALASRLVFESKGQITKGRTPTGPHEPLLHFATKLRLARDYLRYLNPVYLKTPKLRERAKERTPRGFLAILRIPWFCHEYGRHLLEGVLNICEQALERPKKVMSFLREQEPDIVVLTPLIGLGSSELEYFLGAQALGLRTIFSVWSWDNLSSKAILRAQPDTVTVWNEVQRREAVELHGVPTDRVVITGSQCFDRWFEQSPNRDRIKFCEYIRLPSTRPYILYVCSAPFIGSPSEAKFVQTWLKHVRSEPKLHDIGILIRPHPSRLKEWADITFDRLGPVVLWGENPINTEARADYFDSMFHAAVVVGLNTSAMIEAAVVAKPVLTVLHSDFSDSQEGTLHFSYLLDESDGLLWATRNWNDHVSQLADAVVNPEMFSGRSIDFVGRFVRPRGLKESATSKWVLAVEQTGSKEPIVVKRSLVVWALGYVMVTLMRSLLRIPVLGLLLQDPIEVDEEEQRRIRIRTKRQNKRKLQIAARQARITYEQNQINIRRSSIASKRDIRRAKHFEKFRRGLKKKYHVVCIIAERAWLRLKNIV